MLDAYHILTLTHRHASLEHIGRAIIPGDDAAATLLRVKAHFEWEELLYTATCNRAMYLFYSPHAVPETIASDLLEMLRPDLSPAKQQETAACMQLLHGSEAVRHILEVASSMDSLVVGEREIIRQLREAYDRCHEDGLTGDHLRLLLGFTIETAKEIYTQTGIGEKAVSVVALAFQAMCATGLSTDARILMVGAGETNAKFVKFLHKYGYRNVSIFNRTHAKALALADTTGARAFALDELPYFSEGFDALVVCTGSTNPVITAPLYAALLGNDNTQKVVVDLSVPNNVDRAVVQKYPMQYIEIEGLRAAARENLAYREKESIKASEIITHKILAYRALWHERQVERSISHIPGEVRAVKERAVEQVFAKEFMQLGEAEQDLVLRMLGYMEKKCIAIPMKALKAIALQQGKKRLMVNG